MAGLGDIPRLMPRRLHELHTRSDSLMQAMLKDDRLRKTRTGSAACLVPLPKMITIVLVTCLPSVVDSSLL